MKLYLIRHGQTKANLQPAAFPWNNDCPLTREGRRQATATAHYIAALPPTERPARILTSPLLRAKESAELIAEPLGLCVTIDDRLTEGQVGEWAQRSNTEVYSHFMQLPPDQRYTFVPPGGESWQQAGERLCSVIADAADDEPLLIVSHFEPIVAAIGKLLQADFADWASYDIQNASVTLLTDTTGHWRADYIGRTH